MTAVDVGKVSQALGDVQNTGVSRVLSYLLSGECHLTFCQESVILLFVGRVLSYFLSGECFLTFCQERYLTFCQKSVILLVSRVYLVSRVLSYC